MSESEPSPAFLPLDDALAVRLDGDTAHADVADGYDIFGLTHGGYLLALAAHAVLARSEQPDLFTVTGHFLRKTTTGPVQVHVHRAGGSRRFTTWWAQLSQDGEVALTVMASVGDRTGVDGPGWSDVDLPRVPDGQLTERAGAGDGPTSGLPAAARRLGLRLDRSTVPFLEGRTEPPALVRGTVDVHPADQLAALVACDITPPPVWNALGAQGWVPTLELTAHLRARPEPGPMTVEARTRHVSDGFLEEDALVVDATGRLVCQSRQLARWTQPSS